jgi:hypothetical protein
MSGALVWYRVRDMLCGRNSVRQDVKKALELAGRCDHPMAVWLGKLFHGLDVNTEKDAIGVFLKCGNDPRAICLAAVCVDLETEIRRAADMGDAFAQATMAEKTSNFTSPWIECFVWAEKSARQGERDGFDWLGRCYSRGEGREKDVERAKENYLIAAKLGSINAMLSLGEEKHSGCYDRFRWLRKAALRGCPNELIDEMMVQTRKFKCGNVCDWKVRFALGFAMRGQLNVDEKTIFGSSERSKLCFASAHQLVSDYDYN